MATPTAGAGRVAEAAGEQPAAPHLELPFAQGVAWVVLAPAEGRRPGRHAAWAASFRPAGEVSGNSEYTVVAPVAGRVRLLDVRPPIVPVWCEYDGVWAGPQHEVAIDFDDGWTVLLGALDHLAVGDGQDVATGQILGRLSQSTCNGDRALELLLWRSGAGGVRSFPFRDLGGYRADELTPGRTLVGAAPDWR
jgi:hypothetical protein